MIRVAYLVHRSPGRLRMRLPFLHRQPDAVGPLADRLANLPGMEEVIIRPYTGSVLCMHDPHRLSAEAIVRTVRDETGFDYLLQRGERSRVEEELLAREALRHGSDLARAFACFFKTLDVEILRASAGRIDLGTLAAVAFAAAGAAEVIRTGKLPLPPWFNLGWWAFRTFATTEQTAIAHATPTEPLARSLCDQPSSSTQTGA